MLILKAQNVVSEGIPIVYVYQMHQQNGSFAQNVDSEDIPGSTNGVNRKARNNKLDGDRAPPTSTNVLIYKMGWPPRLQFLAPFHISCNPDINKVGNRSCMIYFINHLPRDGGLSFWVSNEPITFQKKDQSCFYHDVLTRFSLYIKFTSNSRKPRWRLPYSTKWFTGIFSSEYIGFYL